jgi:hypothetical protein
VSKPYDPGHRLTPERIARLRQWQWEYAVAHYGLPTADWLYSRFRPTCPMPPDSTETARHATISPLTVLPALSLIRPKTN